MSTQNYSKNHSSQNDVLRAFKLASELRALMLTEEKLASLNVEPIEQILDDIELIALELLNSNHTINENIAGAKVQTKPVW